MFTPDRKVRKLMEEYQKTRNLSLASLRSDMDPKTARKYIRSKKMPSEMQAQHTWRTRQDPFSKHWGKCESILAVAPELEAKFIFEWLCETYPGEYQEGQLRTFQRRVHDWCAINGPDKEVYFPQLHKPGVRMSTDFTHADGLQITINNKPFPHLLCNCVLTYSNWQWATICHSESILALRTGIQAALFQLGRVPHEHWTDHSSAATHAPGADDGDCRQYNQGYLAIMNHFGMKAHTIQVNSPHENGDVESLNGVLKRRLKQHLLMRGSSDFASLDSYRDFLEQVIRKANIGRSSRLAEDLAQMPLLNTSRLATYNEYTCLVRSSSTITVERRIYSLPSRLIGEKVKVRRYENHLEVYYHSVFQQELPWISRDSGHYINYRHIIRWLIRKPGAFRQYRFRQELFPSDLFRWAWDQLSNELNDRNAEREYLQLLQHAADTMQCEVEAALSSLRDNGQIPRLDNVLPLCRPIAPEPPRLKPLVVKLEDYDRLLNRKEDSV